MTPSVPASAGASEARPGLLERYRRAPRAMKWLVWAVAGMVGYFGLVDPVLSATASLNSRADSIERRLTDSARLRGELARQSGDIQRTLQALGLPRGPFKQVSGDAYAELDALLSRLRARHELSSDTRSQGALDREGRPTQQLAASLPWLTGPGGERKLDRYTLEWRFDCTTDQLLATLADLEAAPEVHAVSALEVRKADAATARLRGIPTLLSARVTVEFWAIPKEGGAAFESIARPFTAAPRAAPAATGASGSTEPDGGAPPTSPPPTEATTPSEPEAPGSGGSTPPAAPNQTPGRTP